MQRATETDNRDNPWQSAVGRDGQEDRWREGGNGRTGSMGEGIGKDSSRDYKSMSQSWRMGT